MKFTVIHATKGCQNSTCPTIYMNEKGNYVIQGFKLTQEEKSGISIPEQEDAVEIPADFLKAFVEKNKL